MLSFYARTGISLFRSLRRGGSGVVQQEVRSRHLPRRWCFEMNTALYRILLETDDR